MAIHRTERVDDLGISDDFAEAVGAEKENVPRLCTVVDDVGLDRRCGADRARNDIAIGMTQRLLGRDRSGIDQLLHRGVIAREKMELRSA